MELKFIKRIRFSKTATAVFSIMRDEDYFLPFFLAHHRELGVAQFLIYADRCNETFLSRLMAEPDVAVVTGEARFGDSFELPGARTPVRLGAFLKIKVPPEIFPDQWVLTADADEFLVLPPPLTGIDQLAERLERRQQFFSFAPMVDFFPALLADRNYDPATAPIRACPFFERGPYHRIDGPAGRVVVTSFGVRGRMLASLKQQCPDEIAAIYGARPILPPMNFKYPLIRNGRGILRGGDHVINAGTSRSLATALAHFKFYPGLDQKIAAALSEAQYYNASAEYRFLKLAIERFESAALAGPQTIRFLKPDTLVQAELLQAADD
jgi:hypothetical protein